MKSNLEAGQLRKRLTPALYTVPVIERIEVRKRVVPPSRSCHVRGWNPVREGHPAVAFESLLECRVISALAKYPQLKSIASQPVSVTYQHLEKSVRYTTDLLVEFQSVPDELLPLGFGLTTYIEVKPFLQAIRDEPKLARQFAALRAATDGIVVLVTDLDVPPLFREVRHGR